MCIGNQLQAHIAYTSGQFRKRGTEQRVDQVDEVYAKPGISPHTSAMLDSEDAGFGALERENFHRCGEYQYQFRSLGREEGVTPSTRVLDWLSVVVERFAGGQATGIGGFSDDYLERGDQKGRSQILPRIRIGGSGHVLDSLSAASAG